MRGIRDFLKLNFRRSPSAVFLIFSGWGVVAFGQPAWSSFLAYPASCCGYALFWLGVLRLKKPASQFIISLSWFAGIQAVQLSWMTSVEYIGALFLIVYALLCLGMGFQFALLSRFVFRSRDLHWRCVIALAGFWVFMEWGRLFICTGFGWNPAGMSLTACQSSLQAASLGGVYGLSFWVMLTNFLALKALLQRACGCFALWAVIALAPFAFGSARLFRQQTPSRFLSALLIQTALLPDERSLDPYRPDVWVSETAQWERILRLIHEYGGEQFELIVLPEACLPFTTHELVYSYPLVEQMWRDVFGKGSEKNFPFRPAQIRGRPRPVSNAFWFQALANRFGSEVIVGLEDKNEYGGYVNAALHFTPESSVIERYEKRILVPIGEYVPFSGWKFLSDQIASRYGITSSFTPGSGVRLFRGKYVLGVSICVEETFGWVVRETGRAGAELLVNLSNDGWFPHSRLARQHFDLGVIRAVESGVPSIRACTIGITCGIDCFGKVLGAIPEEKLGALVVKVPMQRVFTFYNVCGDAGILFLSAFSLLLSVPSALRFLRISLK